MDYRSSLGVKKKKTMGYFWTLTTFSNWFREKNK